MRIRAAKLLGGSIEDREEISKDVRDVYRVLSSAVHGGYLKSENEEILRKGQDLVRRSMLKIMMSGTYPEWERLDIE